MTDRISPCSSTRGAGAALAFVSALLIAPLPAAAKSEFPSVVTRSAAVTDWLSPRRDPKSGVEAARQRDLARALDSRHGRGSFICSASGFGQKSRCFAR